MLNSVFLPLLNFILISLFGRYLSRLGVMYLTCYLFIFLLFYNLTLFSSLIFYNTTYYINLGLWFNVSHFIVYWDFIFDLLGGCMLIMVSIISCLVHFYSFAYMKTDPHFIRFISFLSFFTFFMFILVTANNFLQLFLGWEGVGLCSYLLINFWFTRLQANKAAIKALLMNRVGDIGFLFGVALIFNLCYTVDFSVLSVLLPLYAESQFSYLVSLSYIDMVSLCFFIGVVGKSAQLGLHTWLPAAMEGPTPVSALIHAATMVTAGIFLMIRCSFLFENSTLIRSFIIILGLLTAFFSAFTAIFLYDIKKIIAYSTCSQLGYMALACGLSQYYSSLFHLVNHAFFKALLFLAAGAVIHTFNNEQDIRKLPLLFTQMPFLWIVFLVGNVAIMGLPFLAGFYSKDLIIEFVYLYPHLTWQLHLAFLIILLATFCTGLYSLRLTYYLFFKERVIKYTTARFQQPNFIQFVLSGLLFGSCIVGYCCSELLSSFFNGLAFSTSNPIWLSGLEGEWLPWYIKLAPFFINTISVLFYSLFMIGLSSYFYFEMLPFQAWSLIRQIKIMGQNNFYFNEVYNYLASLQFYFYYRHFFLIIDKGLLEFIGPSGVFFFYRKLVYCISWFYYQNLFLQLLFLYHSILAYFFYWFFFIS